MKINLKNTFLGGGGPSQESKQVQCNFFTVCPHKFLLPWRFGVRIAKCAPNNIQGAQIGTNHTSHNNAIRVERWFHNPSSIRPWQEGCCDHEIGRENKGRGTCVMTAKSESVRWIGGLKSCSDIPCSDAPFLPQSPRLFSHPPTCSFDSHYLACSRPRLRPIWSRR